MDLFIYNYSYLFCSIWTLFELLCPVSVSARLCFLTKKIHFKFSRKTQLYVVFRWLQLAWDIKIKFSIHYIVEIQCNIPDRKLNKKLLSKI